MRKPIAKRRRWAAFGIFIGASVLLCVYAAYAQNAANKVHTTDETFKARLSTVPIDATMLSTVAGSGSVTAVLAGKHVSIAGTFEGLRSPATSAQIHQAAKGLRGPAILDLMVSKEAKGAVSGSFELSPEQIADLRNGRWYVQIQSERAPDGNLWGWLLH